MWQRIQTVFLSIVILSLVAAIFLPIWVYQDAAGKAHALYALHYSTMENGVTTTLYFPYAITAILMAASATLAFIEIRTFKNRIAQIKMGALNALLIAGSMCSAVYFATEMIKTYKGGSYGLGLWMPAVAVVCNWLAIRFIKKDEKLVRDSSRLR
jgi:ABC-type Na+ efflux pump permease subunit